MIKDLYSNYGDIKAMQEVVDNAPELNPLEDTRGYSLDDLYAVGAAKQAAIDEHNLNLAYTDESFIEAVAGSWKHNTATGMVFNKAMYDTGVEDPDFDLTLAKKSVEPALLTDNNQEILSRAKNQEHFDLIADNLRDYEEHKLNMEKLGFGIGLGAQLIAETGNLINYVPFFRAFGLTKMRSTKQILGGAALQGSLNTGEEMVINSAYNDRTASDYVASFAMGAGFTGAIAGSAKVFNAKTQVNLNETAERADAFGAQKIKDKADETIATNQHGGRPDRDYTNSGPMRNADRELNPKVQEDMIAKGYDATDEVDIAVWNYDRQGLIPKVGAVPQEKIGLAGVAQTLHRSDNPFTRYNTRVLMEHGEGNYGFHKEHTAALEAAMYNDKLFVNYGKALIESKGLFETLTEGTNIKPGEFDRIMYRYNDGGHKALDPRVTPEMKEVLDNFKEVLHETTANLNKHCEEAGVDEFKFQDFDEGYIYRKYDPSQFYALSQKHGDGGEAIKQMLEESIHRGGGWEKFSNKTRAEADKVHKDAIKAHGEQVKKQQKKIDEIKTQIAKAENLTKEIQAQARLEKAVRKMDEIRKIDIPEPVHRVVNQEEEVRSIAEAIFNRFYNRSTTNTADANLFSTNNRSLLMETLQDMGLSDAKLKHFKAVLDSSGRDTKTNPMKERIKMDMSVTKVVNGEEISMLDLLDIDLGSGFYQAGRYWVGRAAMARKGDHFASEEAIQRTLAHGAKQGRRYGLTDKQVQKELLMQQQGVRLILGQPLEDTSSLKSKAMRTIRKLVATSSLGKLGIVQAGETGRMIGQVEAAMRFPMIKDLMQGVATGKIDSASLKSIEDAVVGNIGYREVFQHPLFRADDFGAKVNKGEKLLDTLGYYLSKASGWNRIHKMQIGAMMNTLSQQWYRQIMDGTLPRTQMNDLGIDDLLLKDLKREMTKHSYMIEGLSGKKTVVELNPEAWDPGVRRKFGLMLTRKSNNAIQEINVGETPMWLNTEFGKFLGQFRTFSIAALSKQTTRDYKMLREGDLEGAIAMSFNAATSVMANVVKIGFVAATLPEDKRKEYLAKALTPASLANQTLSYIGPLSPLVEGSNLLGDTLFGDVYQDVAGSKMGFRARGLTTLVPGLAYVNKGYKGVSGVLSGALTDRDITYSDYKALYSTMPFSNQYMFEAINNRVITPTLFD